MAAGKLIGHQQCPECDKPGAEVKEDKSGNPYRWCPYCNAQYFTRGDDLRVRNLKAKMTPLPAQNTQPAGPLPASGNATGAGSVPAPAAPAPESTPAPAPAKRTGFSLGRLS